MGRIFYAGPLAQSSGGTHISIRFYGSVADMVDDSCIAKPRKVTDDVLDNVQFPAVIVTGLSGCGF
jgi:hypothetical protein